jgi:hypothetical protein
MFLPRREWLIYSLLTLGTFGLSLVATASLWSFLIGTVWAYSLGQWVRLQRERRRGVRVKVREASDGNLLEVWTDRKMDLRVYHPPGRVLVDPREKP